MTDNKMNKGKDRFSWHWIGDGTYRAEVHGGWMLKVVTDNVVELSDKHFIGRTRDHIGTLVNIVFIPDPSHQWDIYLPCPY